MSLVNSPASICSIIGFRNAMVSGPLAEDARIRNDSAFFKTWMNHLGVKPPLSKSPPGRTDARG